MSASNILAVAIGSALGGAGRYALSSIPLKSSFPVLTLLVNVLGALLIGFVTGLAARRFPAQGGAAVLFWKTGVCGGFTTFSTFSLETFDLFRRGMPVIGSLYIGISVAGCLLGVFLGEKIAQQIGA